MDKLTHISITNCVKELDALEKLVLSDLFSKEDIADFLKEISWNLSNVFSRTRYSSDEFQHRLIKLLQELKKASKVLLNEDNEHNDE